MLRELKKHTTCYSMRIARSRRSAAPRSRPGAIRCHKNTCLKARTKDLTLKAKDMTENVALEASARNKDQTLKAKASTKD